MSVIATWGKRPFQLILVSSAQFVLLTIVAMLIYPGGTKYDSATSGYHFFNIHVFIAMQ